MNDSNDPCNNLSLYPSGRGACLCDDIGGSDKLTPDGVELRREEPPNATAAKRGGPSFDHLRDQVVPSSSSFGILALNGAVVRDVLPHYSELQADMVWRRTRPRFSKAGEKSAGRRTAAHNLDSDCADRIPLPRDDPIVSRALSSSKCTPKMMQPSHSAPLACPQYPVPNHEPARQYGPEQ